MAAGMEEKRKSIKTRRRRIVVGGNAFAKHRRRNTKERLDFQNLNTPTNKKTNPKPLRTGSVVLQHRFCARLSRNDDDDNDDGDDDINIFSLKAFFTKKVQEMIMSNVGQHSRWNISCRINKLS
mmetsp:Transcript_25864/g.58272  ORF Transcript_25864/g.58272 Transcript_25864/m.58272 type:complete len:124 (+) Transcript_25864:1358-1729(+)